MARIIRSRLSAAKKTALLKKIAALYAIKSNSFTVKRGPLKILGQNVTGVTVDDTSATQCLIFTVSPRYGVVAADVVIQGLTFTAKKIGDWFANDVTITYVNPGVAASLSVAVLNTRNIVVTLAHDGSAITSDADAVKAAIDAYAPSTALVAVAGTGAVPLTAEAKTALTGGSNVQYYGKADIIQVNRLRTRRYAIILSPSANPAA